MENKIMKICEQCYNKYEKNGVRTKLCNWSNSHLKKEKTNE